jgi:membrane protease YdiL (CAAX protease family)
MDQINYTEESNNTEVADTSVATATEPVKKRTRSDRTLANLYFLLLMGLMWGINFVPMEILTRMSGNFFINSTLSELLIVIPALLMILLWLIIHAKDMTKNGEAPRLSDRLMFRAVKPSTILMSILYTITLMPLVTLCNIITMRFVENTILEYSNEILDMPIWTAIFVIALLPPFCEELAFRGVVYGGYRRDCRPLAAVVMSALLFGLMHGNINQLAYAFVIGLAMALLVEATGSIWPSILMHIVINSRAVIAMFALDHFYEGIFDEYLEGGLTEQTSAITAIAYVILSIITTMMAGAILAWLSKNEGRSNPLRSILANKTYKKSRVTVWDVFLVLGIIAAAALIAAFEMLT